MAPLTRQRKKAREAAGVPSIGADDRLSSLPGDVFRHILGFLPAQEAARTCLLARIWRDVWKATDRLVFAAESVQQVARFVDRLLDLRLARLAEARPSACELRFRRFDPEADALRVNRWICRALRCEVEALRVHIAGDDGDRDYFLVSSVYPLVSCHLKRLHLAGVRCVSFFLDLTSCPALQDLEIVDCDLRVRNINSPSLRRLSIKHCISYRKSRVRICAPLLVSLRLVYPASLSRTPALVGSMPELVAAHVVIGSDHDSCSCDGDRMSCHHVMAVGSCSRWENDEGAEQFYGGDHSQDTRECVLLSGLAEATDLTLMSSCSTYIFRRDLRWCPTFSKLKTLLINHYWFADCRLLARILDHAPVLEKLTVLFSDEVESNYEVEMKGRLNQKERSVALSEHLEIVEVKCDIVNATVLNLLKFMSALGIWFQF
ncbi:hypothetical protein EJB05_37227 [Eragrostis curvula]|uniref:SWIM-type domain-containing protein n=1 Tax=Eragrostis curvula TaxID=38414 RepID=A0A5J9TQZ5_9POAL|nr:hypothetical protein EJB05_37227 [Eragrostis curvula]